MSNMQQTFIIIKPDAVERGLIGKIISRFEDKYFQVTALQMRWKSWVWCERHYEHIVNKDIRDDLKDFMTAAPIIGIVLVGPNVIATIRQMVGCTDSLAALPGTIRGDFGTSPIMYNVIHAADSEESARKEMAFFFDSETDQTHA